MSNSIIKVKARVAAIPANDVQYIESAKELALNAQEKSEAAQEQSESAKLASIEAKNISEAKALEAGQFAASALNAKDLTLQSKESVSILAEEVEASKQLINEIEMRTEAAKELAIGAANSSTHASSEAADSAELAENYKDSAYQASLSAADAKNLTVSAKNDTEGFKNSAAQLAAECIESKNAALLAAEQAMNNAAPVALQQEGTEVLAKATKLNFCEGLQVDALGNVKLASPPSQDAVASAGGQVFPYGADINTAALQYIDGNVGKFTTENNVSTYIDRIDIPLVGLPAGSSLGFGMRLPADSTNTGYHRVQVMAATDDSCLFTIDIRADTGAVTVYNGLGTNIQSAPSMGLGNDLVMYVTKSGATRYTLNMKVRGQILVSLTNTTDMTPTDDIYLREEAYNMKGQLAYLMFSRYLEEEVAGVVMCGDYSASQLPSATDADIAAPTSTVDKKFSPHDIKAIADLAVSEGGGNAPQSAEYFWRDIATLPPSLISAEVAATVPYSDAGLDFSVAKQVTTMADAVAIPMSYFGLAANIPTDEVQFELNFSDFLTAPANSFQTGIFLMSADGMGGLGQILYTAGTPNLTIHLPSCRNRGSDGEFEQQPVLVTDFNGYLLFQCTSNTARAYHEGVTIFDVELSVPWTAILGIMAAESNYDFGAQRSIKFNDGAEAFFDAAKTGDSGSVLYRDNVTVPEPEPASHQTGNIYDLSTEPKPISSAALAQHTLRASNASTGLRFGSVADLYLAAHEIEQLDSYNPTLKLAQCDGSNGITWPNGGISSLNDEVNRGVLNTLFYDFERQEQCGFLLQIHLDKHTPTAESFSSAEIHFLGSASSWDSVRITATNEPNNPAGVTLKLDGDSDFFIAGNDVRIACMVDGKDVYFYEDSGTATYIGKMKSSDMYMAATVRNARATIIDMPYNEAVLLDFRNRHSHPTRPFLSYKHVFRPIVPSVDGIRDAANMYRVVPDIDAYVPPTKSRDEFLAQVPDGEYAHCTFHPTTGNTNLGILVARYSIRREGQAVSTVRDFITLQRYYLGGGLDDNGYLVEWSDWYTMEDEIRKHSAPKELWAGDGDSLNLHDINGDHGYWDGQLLITGVFNLAGEPREFECTLRCTQHTYNSTEIYNVDAADPRYVVFFNETVLATRATWPNGSSHENPRIRKIERVM